MRSTRMLTAVLAGWVLASILAGCAGPVPTPEPPTTPSRSFSPGPTLRVAETASVALHPSDLKATSQPATTAEPLTQTPIGRHTAAATDSPAPAATSTQTVPMEMTAQEPQPSFPSATETAAAAPPPGPTFTPAVTGTATPRPSAAPTGTLAAPSILSFSVTPAVTTNLGDRLTFAWKASGERAQICPYGGFGPIDGRCREVALAGTAQWITDEQAMAYDGFLLRVWSGTDTVMSTATVKFQCWNLRSWFFASPPLNCPTFEADETAAAGQYFEGGLMIWTEVPDTFYVFYRGADESGFQTFDRISDPGSALAPGASPDRRVGEPVPSGLFEPVSGFGMVWRGEVEGVRADVRSRLGWATEPEFPFTSAFQCMTVSVPRSWTCFLRGPRGETLRLHPDSTAQVRLVWEVW